MALPFRRTASWWASTAPTTTVSLSALTWIGGEFQPASDGFLYGARFYLGSGEPSPRWVTVYNLFAEQLVCSATFFQSNTPPSGWINVWFRPRIAVLSTHSLYVGVLANSEYLRTANALASGAITQNGIAYVHGWQSTNIAGPASAPTTNNNANGVDILFDTK